MITLELAIERKIDDFWPIIAKASRPDVSLPVQSAGKLQLDETELNSQTTAAAFGEYLGRAVFREEIRDAFTRALTESNDALRLLLFVEDDQLKTWRWERLAAPIGGHWDSLLLNQRVYYTLHLPSYTDRRFPPIGRRDLRALIMVANPEGLERFGLTEFDDTVTVKRVLKAFGDIPTTVLAADHVPEAVGPPTLDAFIETLNGSPYTIVHIVAHGRYIKRHGDTVLYLADEQGMAAAVPASTLIEQMRGIGSAHGLPHLAFLSTCESAKAEAEGSMGGLAQRLVRDLGMPAVIAMTDNVSIETAGTLSEHFYTHLREHGEVDRALVEAAGIFQKNRDATVPALFSRLGGRPLFNDSLDRSLTNAEIAYGLDKVAQFLEERAPILIPVFQQNAKNLQATLGAESAALSQSMQANRRQYLTDINALCEEVLDLNFNAIALDQQPPVYDTRCPFLGLYAFSMENRDFFFGREALITTLVEKLQTENLLAILGPSGSGKSSVVFAGLIPALQASNPKVHPLRITPGNNPLDNLDSVFTTLEFNQETSTDETLQETLHYLKADTLVDKDILVVIDQFEEIFTLTTDVAIRTEFFNRILMWCGLQSGSSHFQGKLKIVITMRADFWGYCGDYPALKTAMQNNQELIGKMQPLEMRRAMESQAATVGLAFEPGLCSRIMDDVQDEPGAMPLLQHALLELWLRRHGRWLKAQEYDVIGGVQRAIAETAEKIYQQLPLEKQIGVRNIFVRLTRLDETGDEGGGRDTRKRVPFSELVPAHGNAEETRTLIEQLANARLIVTSVNTATNEEEVEVAHEAIIRYWPKLQGWLNESRSLLRLQTDVQDSSRAWHKAHQHADLLQHRGMALEQVKPLLTSPYISLNQLEQDYIEACEALRVQQEEEEEAQRLQELQGQRKINTMLKIGIVAAVIFIILSTWLYVQADQDRDRAEVARIDAENQTEVAKARELAAYSVAVFPQSAPLSLLLGVEALQRIPPQHHGVGVQSVLWNSLGYTGGFPLKAHQDAIKAVAISEDGAWLISGDESSVVHLWNLYSQPLTISQTIDTQQQAVISLVSSPEGQWFVTGGLDGTTMIWERDKPTAKTVLFQQSGAVKSLALSPDTCWLVSGGEDKLIRVWSLCGQGNEPDFSQPPQIIAAHTDGLTALAFNPNNQSFISTAGDFTTRLWQMDSTSNLWEEKQLLKEDSMMFAVAFTPDGTRLITGGGTPPWISPTAKDAAIYIRQIVTDTLSSQGVVLRGHDAYVTGLVVSHDGQWLISSSWDKTLNRWNLQNLSQAPLSLHGHEGFITTLARGQHDLVVSGSSDHHLRLWDIRYPNSAPAVMEQHQAWVNQVAISPDGQWLVTVSEDGNALLWPFNQAQKYAWQTHLLQEDPLYLNAGDSSIKSLVLSDDGRWLATGNDTGEVWLWDFPPQPDAKPIVLRDPQQRVEQLLISGDSRWLLSRDSSGVVRRWDLHTPGSGSITLPKTEGRVTTMALSQESGLMVTGNSEGIARLWDVSNPVAPLRIFHGHAQAQDIRAVAISARGSWVATGSEDTTIRLWPLGSKPGESPAAIQAIADLPNSSFLDPFVIREHQDGVLALTFSPNEQWLASGGWDNTSVVVDLTQPDPTQPAAITVLRGHNAWVNVLTITPDNQQLITGSHDGTARIWNLYSHIVGENPIVLHGHTGRINSLAVSADSKILVTGSSDNTARQWVLRDDLLINIACSTAGRTPKKAEMVLYALNDKQPVCQ